jgi:hypothetical protein
MMKPKSKEPDDTAPLRYIFQQTANRTFISADDLRRAANPRGEYLKIF